MPDCVYTSEQHVQLQTQAQWLSSMCSHSVSALIIDYYYYYYYTRLTALFPGLPGSAGTRKVKPIWIY